MATKIRQIVPMAGAVTRYTGAVYVTDDPEANRLEEAGFAEVLERGLPDPVRAEPGDVQLVDEGTPAAEGSMAAVENPTPRPRAPRQAREAKAKAEPKAKPAEPATKPAEPTNQEGADAGATNDDPDAGGEAAGDGQQPAA